jgi:polyisoprenoid-binding protein YceI
LNFLPKIICCNEYRENASKYREAIKPEFREENIMTTSATPVSTWNIDPTHSVAEFKVKHMMISNVKGHFPKVSGVLTLDESDLAKSSVVASIDVASVETRDAQRDGHLKSADFFDVEKYPTMTFKSTSVSGIGSGELTVTGNLTIRDVTRPVDFSVEGPTPPAKDPWGNTRVAISATTKISRKDFGLTWNSALETGGVLVGDDVTITLDVQFVKA